MPQLCEKIGINFYGPIRHCIKVDECRERKGDFMQDREFKFSNPAVDYRNFVKQLMKDIGVELDGN